MIKHDLYNYNMVNNVKIEGYLPFDAQVFETNKNMCSFTICNEQGKYKHYFKIITFGDVANIAKTFKKGSLVFVEGNLRSRKWNNQNIIEINAISVEKRIRTPRSESTLPF